MGLTANKPEVAALLHILQCVNAASCISTAMHAMKIHEGTYILETAYNTHSNSRMHGVAEIRVQGLRFRVQNSGLKAANQL